MDKLDSFIVRLGKVVRVFDRAYQQLTHADQLEFCHSVAATLGSFL